MYEEVKNCGAHRVGFYVQRNNNYAQVKNFLRVDGKIVKSIGVADLWVYPQKVGVWCAVTGKVDYQTSDRDLVEYVGPELENMERDN